MIPIHCAVGMDEGGIAVAADGRCDSPGHSALYGIVSFMDTATNLVVSSQLVKVCLLSIFYSRINVCCSFSGLSPGLDIMRLESLSLSNRHRCRGEAHSRTYKSYH